MPRSARAGRVDRLKELHVTLAVAALGGAAFGVLAVLDAVRSGSVSVTVPGDAVMTTVGSSALWPGLTVDRAGEVVLVLEHADAGQVLLAELTRLPSYLLIMTVLVLLWRQVARARRADPFNSGLARRLTRLGWLLTVAGPVVWGVEFCARFALSDAALRNGPQVTLDLVTPFLWALAGLGLLAIGEIVRRGELLHEELDTVI